MKRLILTLFIIIGTFSASAESLLEKFERSLAALGSYRVDFTVTLGDATTEGSYAVSGNDFYITLYGAEYYVADGVKYEVNSSRREVIVDSAESLGSDLLSNPAQGFSILACDYEQTNITIDARAAVKLTARNGDSGRIVAVADKSGNLPQMIVYAYDDTRMTIVLDSISTLADGIPRFDRTKYADFELIDMR